MALAAMLGASVGVSWGGPVRGVEGAGPAPAVDEASVSETARLLGPGFRRYETEHFVVLSDCDVSWTRSRASLLERTRHQYFRVVERLGVRVRGHDRKLLCVLFEDPARYRAFARAHDGLAAGWVSGYYATHANRVVFYNDENAPDLRRARETLSEYERAADERRAEARRLPRRSERARRLLASAERIEAEVAAERERLAAHGAGASLAKTIHEAVHLLAFNTGLQDVRRDYPFWLSEGMATSFETYVPDAAFGPDQETEARRERLRSLAAEGRLVALGELVSLSAAPDSDAGRAEAMYHQSYALFAHLYRHERGALGSYFVALGEEPGGPLSARRQLALFEAHFGDVGRLERRLAAEIERR